MKTARTVMTIVYPICRRVRANRADFACFQLRSGFFNGILNQKIFFRAGVGELYLMPLSLKAFLNSSQGKFSPGHLVVLFTQSLCPLIFSRGMSYL